METTTNYGLKKPDLTDYYDIADQNYNSDLLDTQLKSVESTLSSHTSNKSNPHKVSKSQVGLGNVDNTADLNKPISTATQAELDKKALASDLTAHTGNTSNPHGVTKGQVGLGSVPNVTTNDQTPTYTTASSNTTLVSGEKLSVAMGKIAKAVSSLISHLANTSNPHSVTKSQVGLSNVPNVSTNDQTPTYTVASSNTALVSGEKLSVAFGKIAKAINSLISHLSDTVGHITIAERTAWNGKLDATATAVNADKLGGYSSDKFMYALGYGSDIFGTIDMDNWNESGCYASLTGSINVPPDTDGWGDVLIFGCVGDRLTQLFRPWNKTSSLYFRCLNGSKWESWKDLMNDGNADTLDGYHGGSFINIDGSVPMVGAFRLDAGHGRLIASSQWTSLQSWVIGDNFTDGRMMVINNTTHTGNGTLDKAIQLRDMVNGYESVYDVLHTGNSAPVVISATAPTNAGALWVDTTANRLKIYKNNAWTTLY